MSKLFDFKKRFGQIITLEEVRANFVIKINHHLFPVIDDKIGNNYSEHSDYRDLDRGSRMFDYICVNFGFEPRVVIRDFNKGRFDTYSLSIPSIQQLTNNNFEKTLLVTEIIYSYFKNSREYGSEEIVDSIEEMVNEFLLQPISPGVFWRNGKFYPEGAKELDNALIREPLDWLSAYPKIQKIYKNALDNYSRSNADEIKRKDVCINAYQAVEDIAQRVVGKKKAFDNIFEEFGEQIGLNSYWKKILNQYREFSKEYGRHSGRSDDFIPDKPSTEAFLYLSGLLLRLSIEKLSQKK